MKFLDCTMRDGGYYNSWDFDSETINQYLNAMQAAGVDVVELGFRSLKNDGYQGPCAFTTDNFIMSLDVPKELTLGVMVNGSELVGNTPQDEVLNLLFPHPASESPVDLVRIACHTHEFGRALPAVSWLKEKGYQVGFNLMQVAECSEDEIKTLASQAKEYSLDVLYFADSMGSMNPDFSAKLITWFRSVWEGELGIHTHDNLGLALSNTLRALDEGVKWVDSTVTGMGRGPGNARTEELAIEIAERRKTDINLVPLMSLIEKQFKPMQLKYGWGSNPYYYLSGKYGIHPTYIQKMLSDSRYKEEDILAVIEHLRIEGGKKFNINTLDAARHFYVGEAKGSWSPLDELQDKDVLLLATGPGVQLHRNALERFIEDTKPVVLALNTLEDIEPKLIDYRVACHPVRLLADCRKHADLTQPLITPYSMLPEDIRNSLSNKETLDFGLKIEEGKFSFSEKHCTTPSSLVMAYAFAICASGKCNRVYLAGFDGYSGEDARNFEMNQIVRQFKEAQEEIPLIAVTPSRYDVIKKSIYGINS